MIIENLTSMEYWYPLIKYLPIPQPKTEIVLHKEHTGWMSLLDEVPLSDTDFKLLAAAGDKIGYPLFLRTDLCSGKHDYLSTCYVSNREDLGYHIFSLVDDNCCKDLEFTSFVFREFIELDWTFLAFRGLPIAPERRYFVKCGEVTEHYPYWPEGAITHPSSRNWIELLQHMNKEPDDEIQMLTRHAIQVSKAVPGYWSVDFAKGRNGIWYLIDMAEGDKSWHPNRTAQVRQYDPHHQTLPRSRIPVLSGI